MPLLHADIALYGDDNKTTGERRIALLEAVGREGSIAAAARASGLSYKAAWDALDAMQNLVSEPLLEKTSGGKGGGGAQLSPGAVKLIETYHRLQSGLAQMLSEAAGDLKTIGLSSSGLLQGFMMRTSARNIFSGHIEKITGNALLADVAVRISSQILIHAEITRKSVETLGLVAGRHAAALVKAPFVDVWPIDKQASDHATDNQVFGVIRNFFTDGTTAEIIIDIDEGKTLAATMAQSLAQKRGLADDQQVLATFAARHVIIATH